MSSQLIGVILLLVPLVSFSQTESSFLKIDSTNNKIDNSDSCDVAECYTCDELTSLSQYITDLERIQAELPILREQIVFKDMKLSLLESDKEDLNKSISLLVANEKDFKANERKYLSEIASINMDRTDLILKGERKNKTIAIVSGVGALLVTALIIPIVIMAK